MCENANGWRPAGCRRVARVVSPWQAADHATVHNNSGKRRRCRTPSYSSVAQPPPLPTYGRSDANGFATLGLTH
jgi:hypothetical protein